MVGAVGTVIRPTDDSSPLLLELGPGAPRVSIHSVHLLGQLKVGGGELALTDCTIEAALISGAGSSGGAGRRLESATERAFSMVGGHAVLIRVSISGHSAGAIDVAAASLILIACTLRDNWARTGGALLVRDGADVTAVHTAFINNGASESGGALQVHNVIILHDYNHNA